MRWTRRAPLRIWRESDPIGRRAGVPVANAGRQTLWPFSVSSAGEPQVSAVTIEGQFTAAGGRRGRSWR